MHREIECEALQLPTLYISYRNLGDMRQDTVKVDTVRTVVQPRNLGHTSSRDGQCTGSVKGLMRFSRSG